MTRAGVIAGDKEIGVISPYLGQCGKIRRLFGRSDCQLEGIKVGTVEEFQGQVGYCFLVLVLG